MYSMDEDRKGVQMLLVGDSMTREVVTLTPNTTAGEALALCRKERVRHFPVVEDGWLVGVVSDRDLRSATPALGDPARAAALEEVRVSGVMAREVLTAHPEDPIEQAANTMREKKIGCLPVVENGELAGIITSSDVMAALVYLVGAHEPGSRLEVSVPDRPGALAKVVEVFGDGSANILSVVVAPPARETPFGERVAVFRIGTISPQGIAARLEDAGYSVLWPPRP